MSYDPEPEIKHYLERLSRTARDLPKARRRELIGEIELHIRMAIARTPCANREEMVELLEQVGDPAEIVAAAHDQDDAGSERLPGRIAPLRLRRPRTLILALVLLVVVALAIGAAAWTQTYQPLAFAPADVLSANSINTYGENDQGAWVGYHTGIGGGPNRPFFGVTIQNTGPFTVRVVGLGKYGPALPVLRGWSSRLLMAQGRFVQEPNRLVRTTNGRFARRRVWQRGRLEPFHPLDLAPGQILMIAFEGVWHMDCHPVTVGAVTPPRSFPVRYSFLWKTTTTQIPLPGGLTIAPPNRHPYTDCHNGRGEPKPARTQKHSA